MNKVPYLSVIIPLYNKETEIKRSIDSVLNQEFSDFELIVVNDGSTDSSQVVVESIKDERIKLINQPNGGVSAARNRGVEEAVGKYVVFLDADDKFLPQAFNLLEDDNTADVIIGSFVRTDKDGIIDRTQNNKINGIVENNFKSYWRREIFLRMGNMFIKREILKQKGGLRTDMTLFEDTEWKFRIIENTVIYSSKTVVMEYNRGMEGLSRKLTPIELEYGNIASVKNISDKYKRRVIGDFVFRRFAIRLRSGDWKGVSRIYRNNSFRMLYCTICGIWGKYLDRESIL